MQKIDNLLFWFAASVLAVGYAIFFVLVKLCGLPSLCAAWSFNPKKAMHTFFTAVKNHMQLLLEVTYARKKVFSK